MKTLLLTLIVAVGMMVPAIATAGQPVGDEGKRKDKKEQAEAAEPATPAEHDKPPRVERPAPESRKGPPVTQAEVARGQFTTGIKGREPVDSVNTVDNTTHTVFFFTEIRDGRGQTITHEWWRDGERIAEVPFNVGGNRWRVWSSKDLLDEWTGEWSVRVVDGDGNKLSEQSFKYTKAPEGATPADEQDMSQGKGKGKGQGQGQSQGKGMGDDRSGKKSGNTERKAERETGQEAEQDEAADEADDSGDDY